MASWKLGPALCDRQHGRAQAVDRTPLTRAALRQILAEHPAAGRRQRAVGCRAPIGDELVSHPKVRMVVDHR
jgi:acyl-CoA reductase-like NAD-dependent aldehyde dehydrogenase